MLEYDNSAFYYFAITILVIYLIPSTWFAVSEIVLALIGSGDVGSKARTVTEKEKAANLKKKTTGMARLKTSAYITNLVLCVLAWACFLYLMALVVNDGEVNTFDPFVVLGIAQDATTSEVKKAYRKLSLKYHPDKNIGDRVAEEMFMKIAKAYEALTDEVSKANYEKFGNPDGKQALEVSIGLPSIILDNPKVVLVLYLIAMVVIIPTVVAVWYNNSKQYGENNIKHDTYNTYYTILNATDRLENLPEVLASSAECREINTPKPSDNKPMGLLHGQMTNQKLMIKPKFKNAMVLRGNVLLHAHMLRLTDKLNATLSEDLAAMLSRAPELIDGIVEIAYQRKHLDLSLAAIQFAQCVVQGLWTAPGNLDAPTHLKGQELAEYRRKAALNKSLEQLPNFNKQAVAAVTTGTKDVPAQAQSLGEYLRVPDSYKKGMEGMTQEQQNDVLSACALIPNLKVTTKLFVEEEEQDFLDADEDQDQGESSQALAKKEDSAEAISGDQIYEQDLVTLRITLTRENVPKGSQAGPAYAPHFPKTVRENWWVVLTAESGGGPAAGGGKSNNKGEPIIYAFEKVSSQDREVKHEVRFMAPQQQGTYQLNLRVLSDKYLGLDQSLSLSYNVLPSSLLPEYQPHPEDKELDNEPTLFEQVMAANVDEESSDEEDGDDDEDDEDEGEAAVVNNGGKRLPQSNVVEDVDDDSEEED